MKNPTALENATWFLTRFGEDGRSQGEVPVHCTPFRVGRNVGLELQLPVSSISKEHAELSVIEDALMVRDLGSTNGTLVNGRRINGTIRLMRDDLLQFASSVFRVGQNHRVMAENPNGRTVAQLPAAWAMELLLFDRLLNERAVTSVAQPIIDLRSHRTHGYELLGRGQVEGLESPKDMFGVATKVDMLVELSTLLRNEAGRSFAVMPLDHWYFVNTHPVEVVTPELVESIKELAGIVCGRPVVIEIHEGAVTNLHSIRELRAVLKDYGMRLAYDDFGAGQARLLELAEASPDYVKFDMQLIRGIDQSCGKRAQMLGALVNMVHELGILALAEGVETDGEAKICAQLGFDYGQGYYYGRPAPLPVTAPSANDTSLLLATRA
ncbi:MAG: EAL domain-containing protein [Planctomycetia bacterium]|nr:EAL domain-containing protein [Planctomycetia bacterium]